MCERYSYLINQKWKHPSINQKTYGERIKTKCRALCEESVMLKGTTAAVILPFRSSEWKPDQDWSQKRPQTMRCSFFKRGNGRLRGGQPCYRIGVAVTVEKGRELRGLLKCDKLKKARAKNVDEMSFPAPHVSVSLCLFSPTSLNSWNIGLL